MDVSAPSPALATDPSNVSSDAAALPEASTLSKHHEPAHALTPPTSEDMNNRVDDDASSDLSELDLGDEEEIEPDHYWDDGRVPVFKPVCLRYECQKQDITLTLCTRQWHSFATSNPSLTRLTSTG